MSEPITVSFVATIELKRLLEQWAAQDDRTVSATLRRILEAESRRRAERQPAKQEALHQTA